MSSASDPRQPNRTRQPASRPVPSGQRPVQLTPRAAQPVARPAQPSSRPAQRPGQQPASRPAQQSAARAAQSAGGARFKQQAPTQRAQAPQSHAHHAHGTHGVAPAARSSYNTHARRGAQKKSSPVPMIIGTVVAVLVLAVIAFFAVPAVKGLLGGEDASVTAGQQVTVTIPDWPCCGRCCSALAGRGPAASPPFWSWTVPPCRCRRCAIPAFRCRTR